MKFSFQAIDANGNPARGVLRADDEANAREALLSETLFPKRLEEVADDEKVTWAPRARILARHGNANSGSSQIELPPGCRGQRTTLHFGGRSAAGELALAAEGGVYFRADDAAHSRILAPGDVEVARLVGFPARTLEIVLVSGESLFFPAGFVFANAFMRRVAKALSA
ncbi:MAG: hypothetical protein PWP23_1762 [Candidatus Sumerlaeota bacterium]|nr:hypothetical protein [Candidatus Sumerlaeota bacterium]